MTQNQENHVIQNDETAAEQESRPGQAGIDEAVRRFGDRAGNNPGAFGRAPSEPELANCTYYFPGGRPRFRKPYRPGRPPMAGSQAYEQLRRLGLLPEDHTPGGDAA